MKIYIGVYIDLFFVGQVMVGNFTSWDGNTYIESYWSSKELETLDKTRFL